MWIDPFIDAHAARGRRHSREDRLRHIDHVISLEGQLCSQHIIHDAAHAKEVGSGCDLSPDDLFGAHKCGRAANGAFARQPLSLDIDYFGNAEVEHLDEIIAIFRNNNNIRRL